MALPMRTSGVGVELIKSFEGFRARATRLPNGAWIVGFGHTASAREGVRVTREDAELVLRHHDLKPIEALISERVLTPLSQNEFDALVSFVFNIGPEAFLESNVLALLNSGERLQAAEGMTAWRKGRVDGEVRVVDALVRRRAPRKPVPGTPFRPHPCAGRFAAPAIRSGRTLAMSRERAVVIEARTEDGRTSAAARAAAETAAAGRGTGRGGAHVEIAGGCACCKAFCGGGGGRCANRRRDHPCGVCSR